MVKNNPEAGPKEDGEIDQDQIEKLDKDELQKKIEQMRLEISSYQPGAFANPASPVPHQQREDNTKLPQQRTACFQTRKPTAAWSQQPDAPERPQDHKAAA